jgi:GNAT superfamily N-acetyltransferase
LVGYDDHKQEFKFINSWGQEWGDGGYGYIDYRTFQTTWVEGWICNPSVEKVHKEAKERTELRKWGAADVLQGVFHCLEIVGPDFERIAWLFALEREEVLDVEELFVRPEHRNKGIARDLVRSVHCELSKQLGREIRYWVPHSDTAHSTLTVFGRLISPFGHSLKPSKMRWAAYEASKGSKATPPEAGTEAQTERPGSPFWPIDEQ